MSGSNARKAFRPKVLTPYAIGASETNLAITDTFPITEDGSTNIIIEVDVSGVTSATGISFTLEDTSNGFTASEVKTKTTAITADGTVTLSFLAQKAGDQADLPLRGDARLVITTGAGDAVTINEVRVTQGQ